MLISVLMPMRNAAPYVRTAIRSVLQETSDRLELLVVDDGSQDGSDKIVEDLADPRIRLLRGPQRGISACLNLAASHARGEVLMRCDADDIYPEGRVARQLQLLEEHPDAAAVCGTFQMINEQGALISDPFQFSQESLVNDITDELLSGILRTHLCTFAIRREAFIKNGGFREFFQTAEDIDFAFRLAEQGRVFFYFDTFYKYRIHGASITHNSKDIRRTFFDRIAREFAIQRRDSGIDDLSAGKAPTIPDSVGPTTNFKSHIIDLSVGHTWNLFSSGERKQAFLNSLAVLRNYPLKTTSWILITKIILKILSPTKKN